MKHALVMTTGICALLTTQAKAVVPVEDIPAIAQAIQTVKQLQDTYGQTVQILGQARQIYGTAQQIEGALAHPNALVNQLASNLENGQLLNPLPGVTSMPGIIEGEVNNLAGNAARFAAEYRQQNQLYTPQGNDPQANIINHSADSTANLQAMITAEMQATQDRIQGLQELQAAIPDEPDADALAALQARVGMEQNYATAALTQAQQLAVLGQQQSAAEQQQREQLSRKDVDAWVSATQQ